MKIQCLTADEALTRLTGGPAGLSTPEASRRLREFGANVVEAARREPLLLRLLRQFTHLFALVLWVGALLALVAEWYDPGQGMATLAVAIVAVIAVNGFFSFFQEYRAERAISSLGQLLPSSATVVREGTTAQVPAAALVPGDIVLLQSGDRVPADCRVIESVLVRVNTSTITGEAAPEPRDAESAPDVELAHARNVLLAGTFLVSGHARAVVFATGPRTEFGQIAHLAVAAPTGVSPLQKEIARLGRVVAFFSAVLALGFFFIGRAMGMPWWDNLIFGIGILVANVPEGLLPAVTLSLAMSSQRMARRNALVRRLAAVEALGSATVICTDKTGTLTQNRMQVARVYASGRVHGLDVASVQALAGQHPRLFEGALLCQNLLPVARKGHVELTGDAMELELVRFAREAGAAQADLARVDEIPFDAERRRLTTVHRTTDGLRVHVKGAIEALLPLCTSMELDGPQPFTEALREQVLRAAAELGENGLRVLAFASRDLPASAQRADFERQLVLSGLVAFSDPPRHDVAAAIARCREAGIKVIMVTGDQPQTAVAVAREIGLVSSAHPVVLTGEQLRHRSDTELQLALEAPEIVFARADPADKRRVVSALKRKREVVAATGDGVNDAPALKEADIGIAMGLSGTDVAREAADLVLADDNFASIVNAVEEGRAAFANLRKFLAYVLTSNVPEMVPYLAFVLLRVPLALTVPQILAVDVGTDMLPALALGAEPPDPEVMRRPPRGAKERLIDAPLLLRAYGLLGVVEAAAAMTAFFFVVTSGGWTFGAPLAEPLHRLGTTACLTAIVVAQMANLFACRSETRSIFERRRGNRLLAVGLATEIALILIIDYTPVGQAIFRTAPIGVWAWLVALPFAFALLAVDEVRKLLQRASRRRRMESSAPTSSPPLATRSASAESS